MMQPVPTYSVIKAWNVLLPVLCYYFMNLLVRFALTSVFGSLPLLSGVAMLAGAAFVWVLVCKDGILFPAEKQKMTQMSQHSLNRKKSLSGGNVLCLTGFGVFSGLAVNSWFFLLGITTANGSYEQTVQAQFSLPLWMAALLYGCMSPVAEEWVFRVVVYRRMEGYYGRAAALFGSSLIFGVFHGNPVQAVYATLLGILLAACYGTYRKFFLPVLLHGGINVAVYAATVISGLNTAVFSLPGALVLSVLAGMTWYLWMGKGMRARGQES